MLRIAKASVTKASENFFLDTKMVSTNSRYAVKIAGQRASKSGLLFFPILQSLLL